MKKEIARFTFHDLKRRGVTATKGDELAASGHRDPRMRRVYDVSVPTVKPSED